MDRAHEQGLNFFDTANVYGRTSQDQAGGRTEEIVGRWFAQGGGRRERTVLATKVYGNMGTTWPNEDRLSALNIRRSADASLRRLQTDYIDLYQMHHVDRDTPWEEIWEAMEVLRHQGKVLYFGSSNFAGWHIAKAQEVAARRVSWAWCPSSPSTTSSSGRSRWRCSPPPSTTASASSPGRRSRAAARGHPQPSRRRRSAVPGQ